VDSTLFGLVLASTTFTPPVSVAPSPKFGQSLFDAPTVANVYSEAKRAWPSVGPFALSAPPANNNLGVLGWRVWKWLR